MTPIAITFHFPPSSTSTSSQRVIATNSRLPHSAYITYDKATLQHAQTHKSKARPQQNIAASPPGTEAASTSSSDTAPTLLETGSKRRKGPVVVFPSQGVKTASLTPLLRPIVTRCSADNAFTSHEDVYGHSHPSPPRRKNGRSNSNRVTPSLTNPSFHPYSRASDLSNTRSSVPSPREVLKAQKAEEDKARLKKESAAAARAATAAKRKKNSVEKSKTRSNSRVPGRRKSDSPTNPVTSAPGTRSGPSSPEGEKEKDRVPVITTESASVESSPDQSSIPTFGNRSSGLKRTRSHGVIPISTNVANGSAIVGIGSPLKAVMSRDEDEEGPRKRSRLGMDDGEPSRRANTHSPVGTPPALPDDEHERLSKTYPLQPGKVLPPRLTGERERGSSVTPSTGEDSSALMRRAVSASSFGGRAGSVGSDGGRERSKREIQLPERLKDYEFKSSA